MYLSQSGGIIIYSKEISKRINYSKVEFIVYYSTGVGKVRGQTQTCTSVESIDPIYFNGSPYRKWLHWNRWGPLILSFDRVKNIYVCPGFIAVDNSGMTSSILWRNLKAFFSFYMLMPSLLFISYKTFLVWFYLDMALGKETFRS